MRASTIFLATALGLLSQTALGGDYAHCILDSAPGLQSDAAAYAAHSVCISKYPGGLNSVEQGSGRGFFSFKSGAECTLKRANETRSHRAAVMISVACRKLYDERNPFDYYDK